MQVSIEIEGHPRLKALRKIEVERLALVSGYNGIGKSTAIRLLELCAGMQPWRFHASAWRSLCAGLQAGRVSLTNLDGAKRIIWELKPDYWPASESIDVPPEPDDSWFDITIDGRAANLSDATSLLEVRRIAGDMTLVQTIALEITHLTERFARLSREARGPTALSAVELLAGASGHFYAADASTVDTRRASRDEAVRKANEAQARVVTLGERLSALENAAELARREALLRGVVPDLDEQLRHITTRLDAAASEFEQLQNQLREAEIAAARAEGSRREVENARRLAQQHQASLRDVNAELAQLLSALDVDAESEGLDARVRQRLKELREELEELRRRRHEIDASPLLDSALAELVAVLGRARARGIGDEVIIATDVAEPLTVERLHDLLRSRRIELASRPTQGTSELDQAIRRVESVQAQMQRVSSLLAERRRIPPLIERAERRVDLALADVPGTEQLRQLADAVARAEASVSVLAEERAVVAGRRLALAEGSTPDEVSSRLAAAIAGLGASSRDELETLRVDCTRDLSAARTEHEVAQREAQRAADALEAAQLEYQIAREAIAEDSFLRRIGDAVGGGMPPAQVARRAEAASGLLQDLPNRIDGVRGVLQECADHVAGRGRWPENDLAKRVAAWLTETIGGWFRDPAVRVALFPSADSIAVNLRKRQVEWTEGTDTYELPFEAFSSGQQAFAYTKARLEELGKATSANRIIALDEFGAFLARDLMDDLRTMLVERAGRHPADRVLLVLPLTDDPEAQARITAGKDRDRHLHRHAQLTSNGYYMEEIT